MRAFVTMTFDEFWQAYPPRGRPPRRTSKRDARRAFAKIPYTDHEAVMEGLQRAKTDRQWLDPQYIPHASRWLNQRRWEDEEPDTPPRYSPKEWELLRRWRNRVGGGCPHPTPKCQFREDCNERQLHIWTTRGEL